MKFRAHKPPVHIATIPATSAEVEAKRAAIQLKDESDRAKEKRWMVEQGRTHQTIVEIGCEWGDSTKTIATENTGIIYAVDMWADDMSWDNTGRYSRGGMVIGHRLEQFKNYVQGCNIEPMQMTSLEAAAIFAAKGVRFDMVFIDASHDYASVKEDILAWRPLLVAGGLLSGHDYTSWAGVKKAVDELIPEFTLPAASIWATTV
jgi:hypothetical protein